MQKLFIIQTLFNYCRLIEKPSYSAIAFFQSILRSIHERSTLPTQHTLMISHNNDCFRSTVKLQS